MLAPAVVYALIDAQTRLYNVVITTSDKMIAKQNAIVNAYLKIKQAAIDTIGAFIKEKEAKIEFAAQVEGLSRKDLKRYIQTREQYRNILADEYKLLKTRHMGTEFATKALAALQVK
jgi:hypothetical protein